jgi:hypothetical protein
LLTPRTEMAFGVALCAAAPSYLMPARALGCRRERGAPGASLGNRLERWGEGRGARKSEKPSTRWLLGRRVSLGLCAECWRGLLRRFGARAAGF